MNKKEMLLIGAYKNNLEIHGICKKYKEAPCVIDKEGHPNNCVECQENKKCDCFDCLYRREGNEHLFKFDPDYEEIEKQLANKE